MRIVELDFTNLPDVNAANEPFMVIGRVVPRLEGGAWTWTEELLAEPWEKRYPDEDCDYSAYIGSPDRIVYLAYSGKECVGQIVLRRDWNRYGFIEDICVRRAFRGRGVGRALIAKAADWAKAAGLCGLALETQDNNVLACRFYAKCGFRIGGVNTMLYRNFSLPYRDEAAIFWYLTF